MPPTCSDSTATATDTHPGSQLLNVLILVIILTPSVGSLRNKGEVTVTAQYREFRGTCSYAKRE